MNIENHLAASFKAVSLANYFNKTNSPDILQKARQSYATALRSINAALESCDQATKDSTMLAVLMLDLFEKITTTTPRSFEALTRHINGALTLAKLRGTRQFDGPIGTRMFLQLSSIVLISCVQRDLQPPPDLLELRAIASQYLDAKDPKWQYSTSVMQFISLRISIKNGSLPLPAIIESAKAIDEKFQTILDNMPPLWSYETIKSPDITDSDDIYEDYFHVFPDHRVTHIWNNIHLSRILIYETIRAQLHKASNATLPENSSEIQRSEEIIASLSTDICATVPQYTRVRRVNKDDPFSLDGIRAVRSECISNFPTFDDSTSHSSANPRFFYYPVSKSCSQLYTPFEAARCYSLTFALYIAARSTASPERLRKWIVGRLRFFSSVMGMAEAQMIADVLEGSRDVNPWTVYAMLGSYSFSG